MAPTTTPADVLAAAKSMLASGLVVGTAGNLSGRLGPDRVCLTPAALPYDTMTLDDLVTVDLDGAVVDGTRAPTTERDLHLAVLRAHPDLGAVAHSHATYASMFAVAHEAIPAAIEEVVLSVGGEVPCAAFEPTGSAALGAEVAGHLAGRAAVLLANHGLVTAGRTPAEALHVASVVDRAAQVVLGARSMGLPVHALPAGAAERMVAAYLAARRGG